MNLVKRIITCVVGIPAVMAMIFLFEQYNFIALSIFIILLAFLGSAEMSRMLFGKYSLAALLSALVCALKYVQPFVAGGFDLASFFFLFSIILVLACEIKRGEHDNFASSIACISKSVLLLVYPGYLLSFIIGMLALENMTSWAVSLFLILVFANDIFAYVFGMLLGRGHGNVVKVSPKKSIAGFAGGAFACAVISILCFEYMPGLPHTGMALRIAIALVVSAAANTGDLAESVFKRSTGVKDSGNIVPGRGGVLDSMDSVIVSAPFFYIIWNLI